MHLLTLNQTKMLKSGDKGFLSAILNLQPSYGYKHVYTCPFSTTGCREACLKYTGRNHMVMAEAARIRKTQLLADAKDLFLSMLIGDLAALERKANRENLLPTCRLNGLSDIDWTRYKLYNKTVFEHFPGIQFIDYTKRPNLWKQAIKYPNYHLTYSIKRSSRPKTIEAYFAAGFNCAQVFYDTLPKQYLDRPVIDGTKHDLRHLDRRGALVGLKFLKPIIKGKASIPESSADFVVKAA